VDKNKAYRRLHQCDGVQLSLEAVRRQTSTGSVFHRHTAPICVDSALDLPISGFWILWLEWQLVETGSWLKLSQAYAKSHVGVT